jgi:hypothetical protein
MRNHLRLKGILAGFMLAVISTGVVTWARRAEVSQAPSDLRRQQEEAFNRGGFERAAAVTGKYERHRTVVTGSPASLFQFLSFSQEVVTGTPVASRAFINSHSKSVDTVFDIVVSAVHKGSIERESTIQIVVPGGRKGFADGSWAQVNIKGFKTPLPRRPYLLFLRRAVGNSTAGAGDLAGIAPMEPTFGGLGIVDLTDPTKPVAFSGGFDTPFYLEVLKSRLTGQQLIDEVVKHRTK